MKYLVWTLGTNDDGSWVYESSKYRYVGGEGDSLHLEPGEYVVAVSEIPKDGLIANAIWHDCVPSGMERPYCFGKKYV